MSLSPWRATRLWLFSGRFTLWPGCRCPYRRFLLRPGAIRFVTPNKTRSTRDSVTGKWKRASGHFVVRLEFSEASLRVQQGLHQGHWVNGSVGRSRRRARKGGPRSTSPEEVERKRKRAGADLGTSSSGRGRGKGTGKKGGKGKGRGNKGGGARGGGVAGRREEKEK